jgi:hypothetical protein
MIECHSLLASVPRSLRKSATPGGKLDHCTGDAPPAAAIPSRSKEALDARERADACDVDIMQGRVLPKADPYQQLGAVHAYCQCISRLGKAWICVDVPRYPSVSTM